MVVTMKVGEGGEVKRIAPKGANYDPLKELYCKEFGKGDCSDSSTVSTKAGANTLSYQAYPKTCYKFMQWKFGNGDVVSANPLTVKRNGNHTITAVFKYMTQAEIKKANLKSCTVFK